MANIKVKISRPTEPTKTVEVSEGSTLTDILEEAGVSLASGESLYWNGEKVGEEDAPQDGDFIQIAGKKEGGVLKKGGFSKFFVVVDEDGIAMYDSASEAQQAVEEAVSDGTDREDIKIYKAQKAKVTVIVE